MCFLSARAINFVHIKLQGRAGSFLGMRSVFQEALASGEGCGDAPGLSTFSY